MESSGKRSRDPDDDEALDDVLRDLRADAERVVELEEQLRQAKDRKAVSRKRAAKELSTRMLQADDLFGSHASTYMSMYDEDEFEVMNNFDEVSMEKRTTLASLPSLKDNESMARALIETVPSRFGVALAKSMLNAAVCNDAPNVTRYMFQLRYNGWPLASKHPYLLMAAQCGALGVFQMLVDDREVTYDTKEVVRYALRKANNPVLSYLLSRRDANRAAFSPVLKHFDRDSLQPLPFVRQVIALPEVDVTHDYARRLEYALEHLDEALDDLEEAPAEEEDALNEYVNYLMTFVALLLEHPQLRHRRAEIEQRYEDFQYHVERTYPGIYDARRARVRQSLIPSGFSQQRRVQGVLNPRRQHYQVRQTLETFYRDLCDELGDLPSLELEELARILDIDVQGKTKSQVCDLLREHINGL